MYGHFRSHMQCRELYGQQRLLHIQIRAFWGLVQGVQAVRLVSHIS